jgi:acetyl-CoA C-acetyltransferase
MSELDNLPANTPILVASGEVVEREPTDTPPMALAVRAAREALLATGASGVADAVDTVSVTRLFSDSMGPWKCPFGRSSNPPMSVARGIGADPAHCIYGEVGGNEPQSRVIEFAGDIARGERSVVLLAGAEARYNQTAAERSGKTLDWNEDPAGPLEDRGWGKLFVGEQEIANGLLAPIYYFALIEQAQALAHGRSREAHRQHMARLFASISEVAAANPCAQYPVALSPADILAEAPLNHLYSKRMVARESVNLGAAVLMCSLGRARALGIPEAHWVFIHGLAEGEDINLSERDDPARSRVAEAVLDRVLDQSGCRADDVGLLDIYSCFPCAVSATAEHLGLPTDGSRTLSLTGGLPYFGGPGNNYTLHALAEAVSRLQAAPGAIALVTAVGGMMSKHAAGIYSRRPSSTDWSLADTRVNGDDQPRRRIAAAPGTGRIRSWVINYRGGTPDQAMILGQTDEGDHFLACSEPGDHAILKEMLDREPADRAVQVTALEGGALQFRLA